MPINNSYDESYGARPIKRYVSKYVETLIANSIIKEEIKYNSKLVIDVKDDKLIVKEGI